MRFRPLQIIAVWSMGFCAATAQDIAELDCDRPDQTESSLVVPLNALQVEAGVTYENDRRELDEVTHTSRSFAVPSVLVRYGIVDWLELRLECENMRETTEIVTDASSTPGETEGSVALGAGIKASILEEAGPIPETAAIVQAGTATKFETIDVGVRLAMSHTLTESIGFAYNIGGELNTDAASFTEGFTGLYTVSLGFDITESLGSYIELFGSLRDSEIPEHSMDIGATYMLTSNMRVDASAGIGITEIVPDYYLSAGLVVRLPR